MPGVARADFVAGLAETILGELPPTRALVAIDGIGASGKTTLLAELAQSITSRPTVLVHADDFFNPAEIRHARAATRPRGSGSTRTTTQGLSRTCLRRCEREGRASTGPAPSIAHLGARSSPRPVRRPPTRSYRWRGRSCIATNSEPSGTTRSSMRSPSAKRSGAWRHAPAHHLSRRCSSGTSARIGSTSGKPSRGDAPGSSSTTRTQRQPCIVEPNAASALDPRPLDPRPSTISSSPRPGTWETRPSCTPAGPRGPSGRSLTRVSQRPARWVPWRAQFSILSRWSPRASTP